MVGNVQLYGTNYCTTPWHKLLYNSMTQINVPGVFGLGSILDKYMRLEAHETIYILPSIIGHVLHILIQSDGIHSISIDIGIIPSIGPGIFDNGCIIGEYIGGYIG